MRGMESVNLTGQFLIAMPTMSDSYFARTLVFVCEHNENGALGIIVNRPIDLSVAGLFEKVDLPFQANDDLGKAPVYLGGPVQTDRGFVLHRPAGEWQSSIKVNVAGADIALTSSRDVLLAMGEGKEPQDVLITLGYAGWEAGQLENELTENAWLTVEANPNTADILFKLPYEERLAAAMQTLGIQFSQLAEVAGHA